MFYRTQKIGIRLTRCQTLSAVPVEGVFVVASSEATSAIPLDSTIDVMIRLPVVAVDGWTCSMGHNNNDRHM